MAGEIDEGVWWHDGPMSLSREEQEYFSGETEVKDETMRTVDRSIGCTCAYMGRGELNNGNKLLTTVRCLGSFPMTASSKTCRDI